MRSSQERVKMDSVLVTTHCHLMRLQLEWYTSGVEGDYGLCLHSFLVSHVRQSRPVFYISMEYLICSLSNLECSLLETALICFRFVMQKSA